jgi:hypothetical protein
MDSADLNWWNPFNQWQSFSVRWAPMTKKLIWIGLFAGSTIGNMVPMLWGGDALSLSGLFFSLVGGIAGIWLGYRWGQSM